MKPMTDSLVDDLLLLFVLGLLTVAGFIGGLIICGEYNRYSYPTSTEDCPPGHVYIDYGETPQAGCWPEGVAQQMGVYPEPEEPNGN